MDERTKRIRDLNDAFRTTLTGGRLYFTAGFNDLPAEVRDTALHRVRSFADFADDNDPWGEHDFGRIEVAGNVIFFKIDYYDRSDPDLGADDPSDQATTERAMTVMLAEEY